MLSKNNQKLGQINSFSLLNPKCKKRLCYKYCYMYKIRKLRPNVMKKNQENYEQSKKNSFVETMNYLLKDSTDMIRIHVDGDFYNQKYLDKWINIAKNNKKKTFYTYTKSIELDFKKRPKNLIIYLSDDKLKLKKHHKRFDGISTISFDKKPIKGYKKCPTKKTCNECRLCTKKSQKIYFDKH